MRVSRAQIHTNDDPVCFQFGDTLRIERQESDQADWFWVVGPDERVGWVFRSYLSGDSGEVTGLRDYDATELDVQPGDHGEALEYADGWWLCELSDRRRGWILATHVEFS